ncbi:MAG: sulfotransferase [Litorimonas sp.]
MTLENIEKIVVIAGCQRSGTTLTGQIIGAHPNAFLIDEGDGVYDWFHSTDNALNGSDGKLSAVLQKADSKYKTAHSRLNIDPENRISMKENISHLVLKAPNLTYSFSRLAELSIPVSVIYPRRDPRSVVASMAKLAGIDMVGNQCRLIRKNEALATEFSSELSKIEQAEVSDHIKRAIVWQIKTKLSKKFVDAGIPTFIFDYEALVTDKKTYCSELARHAGLRPSLMMEEHETVYMGKGPGGTNRTRSIDTNSTFLWKKTLTKQQANDIIELTEYKL